jgi:hypothetical protein
MNVVSLMNRVKPIVDEFNNRATNNNLLMTGVNPNVQMADPSANLAGNIRSEVKTYPDAINVANKTISAPTFENVASSGSSPTNNNFLLNNINPNVQMADPSANLAGNIREATSVTPVVSQPPKAPTATETGINYLTDSLKSSNYDDVLQNRFGDRAAGQLGASAQAAAQRVAQNPYMSEGAKAAAQAEIRGQAQQNVTNLYGDLSKASLERKDGIATELANIGLKQESTNLATRAQNWKEGSEILNLALQTGDPPTIESAVTNWNTAFPNNQIDAVSLKNDAARSIFTSGNSDISTAIANGVVDPNAILSTLDPRFVSQLPDPRGYIESQIMASDPVQQQIATFSTPEYDFIFRDADGNPLTGTARSNAAASLVRFGITKDAVTFDSNGNIVVDVDKVDGSVSTSGLTPVADLPLTGITPGITFKVTDADGKEHTANTMVEAVNLQKKYPDSKISQVEGGKTEDITDMALNSYATDTDGEYRVSINGIDLKGTSSEIFESIMNMPYNSKTQVSYSEDGQIKTTTIGDIIDKEMPYFKPAGNVVAGDTFIGPDGEYWIRGESGNTKINANELYSEIDTKLAKNPFDPSLDKYFNITASGIQTDASQKNGVGFKRDIEAARANAYKTGARSFNTEAGKEWIEQHFADIGYRFFPDDVKVYTRNPTQYERDTIFVNGPFNPLSNITTPTLLPKEFKITEPVIFSSSYIGGTTSTDVRYTLIGDSGKNYVVTLDRDNNIVSFPV